MSVNWSATTTPLNWTTAKSDHLDPSPWHSGPERSGCLVTDNMRSVELSPLSRLSLEGVNTLLRRSSKRCAAPAWRAGLAMGTQTAAGLRDAWAMCICTRPSLDTSVMALITAFRVARLAKHASSSHSVWQSWRLTSTPMTFQAVLVADWRRWLDLCTDAVSTWWSWRVVGFEHEHQGRSADKARADR